MKRSHCSTPAHRRIVQILHGWIAAVVVSIGALGYPAIADAVPPYSGTAFIMPNLITEADPTRFVAITDRGLESRNVFDRRVDDYVVMDVFVYEVSYSDGRTIAFMVNPEFGNIDASRQPVSYYAPVFGRLPNVLRRGLAYVWIHKGDNPFGGTPFDNTHPAVLIHTGALAQSYINQGVLEEILIHEATHAVMDTSVRDTADWLDAQSSDNEFISTYARDNTAAEDVAESFLPYLAVCCGQGRVSASVTNTTNATIPARLRVFDSLLLDAGPLQAPGSVFRDGFGF